MSHGHDTARRKLRPWLWAGGLLLLWLFSWQVIEGFPDSTFFRYELGETVAYPTSDAMHDFLNAMALSTGDGFVNWRVLTRYSTYKPGWVLILAGVGSLCDWDTGRMQRLLTFASSLFVPLLFLLLWRMQRRHSFSLVFAAIGSLFVLFSLTAEGRVYFGTMMTEPPTLLFSVAFSLLAVHLLRSRGWSLRQGFALGLCAGVLLMIRGQPKYGIMLVLLFAVLPAMALHWRRRWPAVAAIGLGAALILAPYWIRTSIHLGQPFTGTCFTSLRAVMEFSPVGIANGGAELSTAEQESETVAINTLQSRVNKALRTQIARPFALTSSTVDYVSWHVTKSVFISRYTGTGSQQGQERKSLVPTRIVVTLLVLGSAILLTLQVGLAGLVPLLFAIGYYLPNALFDFHWERFGVPLEWVGPFYLTLLVSACRVPRHEWRWPRLLSAWRRLRSARRRGIRFARQAPGSSRFSQRRPLALLATASGLWISIAIPGILSVDGSAPRRFPTAEVVLSSPEVQTILGNYGIRLSPETHEEIAAALATGRDQPNARLRHVVLPIFLEPDVFAPKHAGFPLRPRFKPATRLIVASTWKHHGMGYRETVYVPGNFPADYGIADFRHGDWYLLVRAPLSGRGMVEFPLPIPK